MSSGPLENALDIVNAFKFDIDNVWTTLLEQWNHLQEAFESISPPPCQPFQLWAYDKVDPKVLTTVLSELFQHHLVKQRNLRYRLAAIAHRFNLEPVIVCFFLGIEVALNLQCLTALKTLQSNKPEVTLTDIATRVHHLQTDITDSSDSASRTNKSEATAGPNLRGRPLEPARKRFRDAIQFYDPTAWPVRQPKGGPRPKKSTSSTQPFPPSSPVSSIHCSDEMETKGGKLTREASEPIAPPHTIQVDLCPKTQTSRQTTLSLIQECSEEEVSETSAFEQGRGDKGNDHSVALEDTSDQFCSFHVSQDFNDDDEFDDDNKFEHTLPPATYPVFHNHQDEEDSLAQDITQTPSIDVGTQSKSLMANTRRPNLEWLISHLDRFDSGKWFNDDIINTLLRRLCSDSVASVETGAPTSAWRGWTKTPQWIEQASRKAAMLIPFNQGGSHWVLYHYASSILHVYDPLGHDVSRDNITTQEVAPFVSRVYGLALPPRVMSLKGPIQPNTWDCGVYLIAAASILAEGNTLPDKFDGDVLRQRYRNMYLTSPFSTPAESIWNSHAASEGTTTGAIAFFKFKSSVLLNAATSSYADGDFRSSRIRDFLANETLHFGAGASLSGLKALHRQHEAHLRAALEKTAALTIISEKETQVLNLKAIHRLAQGLAARVGDFNAAQQVPPGSNALMSAAKATEASSQTLMALIEAETNPDATLQTLHAEAQGIEAEIAYSYRLCVVYILLLRKAATS
ncbi:uncharacterized protein GLRG_11674 [Colletotrichum graminicola M1.001]|uniref:Ubiquitin-like protease family profile domain-containing protein n=1 Tax=Colletotrichum graminicola (strain M1.001 / M2 / FGSC 10212) TaxID=645133 RepID=E3R0A1_COLGM|nr:uncharacterized protein GLRG_11674 [Colletotrichum graminicola M1.001]EFQ36539.1 hypothetical protein GLRG_11674 [Colletotrichum graminicola M1.001]